MSTFFSAAFRNATLAQKALRREARKAQLAASDAAYFDGARRHEEIITAVKALTTPAIARAVLRDQRVVALCRVGGETYDEVLNALVWAPAEPSKVPSVLSAIFGHKGVLDAVATE